MYNNIIMIMAIYKAPVSTINGTLGTFLHNNKNNNKRRHESVSMHRI